MRVLIASNQPSLYQWIGTVLDKDDTAVLTDAEHLVEQFNKDRYDSVIIHIDGLADHIFEIIGGVRAIATRRWIPIIALSAQMDQAKLSLVFKAGADDIILTSYPSWLLKAKLNALGRVEHIQSELQIAMDRIEQLSVVDPVTQLANHRGVMNEAVRLIGQANREEKAFAIVMIEVDYFEQYQKEHGHQQSQELFRTLALLVEGSSSRPLDFVGRLDDHTLVLLLPETNTLGVQKIGQEVLRHIREANLPFVESPKENRVSATVATYAYNPAIAKISVEQLFKKLRQSLHETKFAANDTSLLV